MIPDEYYRTATRRGKATLLETLQEVAPSTIPIFDLHGAWTWHRTELRIIYTRIAFHVHVATAGEYGAHCELADQLTRAGISTYVKRAYRDRPTTIYARVPVTMPTLPSYPEVSS